MLILENWMIKCLSSIFLKSSSLVAFFFLTIFSHSISQLSEISLISLLTSLLHEAFFLYEISSESEIEINEIGLLCFKTTLGKDSKTNQKQFLNLTSAYSQVHSKIDLCKKRFNKKIG
jgi:hypothetical protein